MVEIIGAVSSLLGKIIDKIPFQRKNAIPRSTLKLVLQPRGAWWHMGSMGQDKKPAMQVVSRWYATNTTDRPIVVTTAFIKKPRIEAVLPLTQHPQRNVFGGYPIPPKSTSELALDFWVQPPKREADEDFEVRIIVLDQFGNEHKTKKITFKYQ